MPALVLLLSVVYLFAIYLLLALAKRIYKVTLTSSQNVGQAMADNK